MIRTIIIGFLTLTFACSSNAEDGDRIRQLERDVQEMKARISKLEALLNNPAKFQELVPSGEGWKAIVNWRRLTTGMDASDVRKVLGEPHRVDGGRLSAWYFKNGGQIHFFDEKVQRWSEPLP